MKGTTCRLVTFCFFLTFPIFLGGCCGGNHQKKRTGPQQDTTPQYYRAVEGEIFMMPCNKSLKSMWTRTEQSGERNGGLSFYCEKGFSAEVKHSGKYTGHMGGSKLVVHLQVVKKVSLGCFETERSSVNLLVNVGGTIPCPGLNCSDNTHVIWYKNNKAVSEQNRALCEKGGLLHLCTVSEEDTGLYFCDRQIIEKNVTWTIRRAVNVTAVPRYKASYPPRIMYPDGNVTEEVELGRPHTLTCKVYFPFEIEFSPKVQWYMNYSGNMENMTPLHTKKPQPKRVTFEEFEVTQRAVIKEVTSLHFNKTYTCYARNTAGNSILTIKLKRKTKVKWPSLVGYPFALFLLVAGLGIILHVKWLELQLIYRSHFQCGKNDADEKEFDVFLSYVWSPPSAEVADGLTYNDEEACLASMDLLVTKKGKATQRPLEDLLPRVLEDEWGYRLCLLERDVLPGGAYTNDVVLALKRSRMLVCVLSADYLTNSNAVFVLESGVQALLQKSALKLLLIWISRASALLIQPDPPLPTLVQRAIRVLPSLDWTSGNPARATSDFWMSLREAMPSHRE